MIVTKTPLRISFVGGGTDIAEFYQEHGGQVVSSAIDKFIYVIIKERFDRKIRLGYTRTEMVDGVDELRHELVREAMRTVGVDAGVELSTMADIPSEGSGLGSSSSVTVGVLLALHTYRGDLVTAERLAQEACRIEIDVLGKPIGKQDQYIAAYGGLRAFVFERDGTVRQRRLRVPPERKNRLGESLMLFFTGVTRKADGILSEQKANIGERTAALCAMRDQAEELCAALEGDGPLMRMGRALHAGWEMKKTLASGVTSSEIDEMYERALDAGAVGGKVAGAGGGGFLLLFCPTDRQQAVREALSGLRELEFSLDQDGAKVIFNGR